MWPESIFAANFREDKWLTYLQECIQFYKNDYQETHKHYDTRNLFVSLLLALSLVSQSVTEGHTCLKHTYSIQTVQTLRTIVMMNNEGEGSNKPGKKYKHTSQGHFIRSN